MPAGSLFEGTVEHFKKLSFLLPSKFSSGKREESAEEGALLFLSKLLLLEAVVSELEPGSEMCFSRSLPKKDLIR